jgi:hypothetical protein
MLERAVQASSSEPVRLFLNVRANSNKKVVMHDISYQYLSLSKATTMKIAQMLEVNADLNAFVYSDLAIVRAMKRDDVELARFLIYVNVNATTTTSPELKFITLRLTAGKDQLELLQLLINKDVDVHVVSEVRYLNDDFCKSADALQIVVEMSSVNFVELLHEVGRNVNSLAYDCEETAL